MLNHKTIAMENQNSEKLKNQDDVKPSEALENLVKDEGSENAPKTTGTGSNNPVPRVESLAIKKEDQVDDEEAGS
jgi:hypothetical protein